LVLHFRRCGILHCIALTSFTHPRASLGRFNPDSDTHAQYSSWSSLPWLTPGSPPFPPLRPALAGARQPNPDTVTRQRVSSPVPRGFPRSGSGPPFTAGKTSRKFHEPRSTGLLAVVLEHGLLDGCSRAPRTPMNGTARNGAPAGAPRSCAVDRQDFGRARLLPSREPAWLLSLHGSAGATPRRPPDRCATHPEGPEDRVTISGGLRH